MCRTPVSLFVALIMLVAVEANAALVSYWPCNDGSGATVANAVNTAYDGTFQSYADGSVASWPLPTWTSSAMFGSSALQFTAQGPSAPGDNSYGLNWVSAADAGGAAGLASATISLWVEWNGPQPTFIGSGNDQSASIYGSVLGWYAPANAAGGVAWQSFQIGVNASTNGAATADPAAMAGLRLEPGYAISWNSGYSANTTADASNTYGMPQNGSGFTAPGTGSWHNIVVTVAPAAAGQNSNWSLYMDGTFLRTVASQGDTAGLLWMDQNLSDYEAYPLTIGGIAQTVYGGMPLCGSNTSIDDVGIFNTNLDDGDSANIGQIKAIYTLGKSSLNYDLGEASTLFGVYANQAAGAAVGGLTWNYVAAGLTGGLGVTGELADGAYYVQLDAGGGGVETTPTTVHNPGDANGDGKVDINDLTIVLSNFGQSGCAWSQGSMDGDPTGDVDINDLTIVLSNFGQTYTAGVAAVPEPGAAALLVAGLAGLLAMHNVNRTRRVRCTLDGDAAC